MHFLSFLFHHFTSIVCPTAHWLAGPAPPEGVKVGGLDRAGGSVDKQTHGIKNYTGSGEKSNKKLP